MKTPRVWGLETHSTGGKHNQKTFKEILEIDPSYITCYMMGQFLTFYRNGKYEYERKFWFTNNALNLLVSKFPNQLAVLKINNISFQVVSEFDSFETELLNAKNIEELKKIRKTLVRKYHPDLNPESSGEVFSRVHYLYKLISTYELS